MAHSQPNGDIHLNIKLKRNQILQFVVLEKILNLMEAQSICSFGPTTLTPIKRNPITFPYKEVP